MDAHFSLPDGGRAHIGCSMFSSSVLRLHAEVTARQRQDLRLQSLQPPVRAPDEGHDLARHPQGAVQPQGQLRLPARRRSRPPSRTGASFPTTAVDADPYHGAHRRHLHRRRPPAAPAHTGRLMPLAADDLSALADAALGAAAALPGGRAPGRAHPEPDGPPPRRAARHDGRRHRLRHGRARGRRRRGRVRRHGRRAAGRGGRPGPAGHGDGEGHGQSRAAGAWSWRPSRRTATSRGRARSRSTRRPCPWPTRWRCCRSGAPGWATTRAVSHTTASLLAVSEQTYLADLNGTRATQHRVRLQAQLEALALSDAGFETMRTLAPPVGRGWEFLADPAGDGSWDWDAELAELPELLAEKLPGPVGRGRHLRSRRRPFEPVAHDPRVDRARHRARPGRRLRGGVRRDLVRHLRPARHARLRLARHARHGRPHGGARPGHRGDRQRGRGGAVLRPRARRDAGRLPARSLDRRRHGLRALQRLRLRRLADARAHSAHGQRVAGPLGRGGPEHRRAHRRGRPRHLHRRRQELVHRHAALQLPVHRAALLPD